VGPKVPDDRLTALRSAFDKMIKDKDFVTEADKSRREIIGPMSGAEVEAMIKEIYATPKNIVSKVGGMTK
jgi:tripartite-type tricarboxylate transporter receptor subunit TctC